MSSGTISASPQLGDALEWLPRALPPKIILQGRYSRLEPLDMARHGDAMVTAFRNTDPASWTYLFSSPCSNDDELRASLAETAARVSDIPYAIVDLASARAAGMASYMRMDPNYGVIEVGNIHYSDGLKRTRITTEAMFLMMRHIFDDLGYRRYEWKCNALNEPSRKTAQRLGFKFEGIFRKHMVVKGHNRDTAWFAVTDDEWPGLKAAYEKWLALENFDSAGKQRKSLSDLIAEHR